MKKNFKLKIAFLWSSVSWEAERAQYAVWQSSVTSSSHFLCQRSLWAPGKVFIKAVCVALGRLGNWPVIRQYLTYAFFPLMANSSHQRRRPTGSFFFSFLGLSLLSQGVWALHSLWDYMLAVWLISFISFFHFFSSFSGASRTLLREQRLRMRVISNCNWKFSHLKQCSVLPQGWCVSKVTTAICFAVGCFYTEPGSPQYVPEQLRVRVGRQYFNWKELHSVLQLLNANRQAEQGNTIYCNLFLATVVWI